MFYLNKCGSIALKHRVNLVSHDFMRCKGVRCVLQYNTTKLNIIRMFTIRNCEIKRTNNNTIEQSEGVLWPCYAHNGAQIFKIIFEYVVICHDVKKFVMTTKIRHDIKKFVMISKLHHNYKNTSWCQKVRHAVKNTS